VLPLRPSRIKTLALIGSDADRFKTGGGSSNVTPLMTATPRQGIEQRAGSRIVVRYDGSDDPPRSAATARGADAAIVVVSDTASEGADQSCLRIDCTDGVGAAGERNLDAVIEVVAEANPRTIVVMETGGPVLTPWRHSVAGLVEAWYPGESGGVALARVLFGDVDPGGRLPATFPDREDDLPQAGDRESFPGANGTVKYKEGVLVGYRWFDEKQIEPAYPFGFGLSYTSFAFSDLEVAPSQDGATVSATVSNRGARSGVAVPQLYLGLPDPGESVVQPPFQLKGFTKVRLARGASRRVTFMLDRRAISYWSAASDRWEVAPGCYRIGVGASSRDLPLQDVIGLGARCARARTPRPCTARRSLTVRLPRSADRAGDRRRQAGPRPTGRPPADRRRQPARAEDRRGDRQGRLPDEERPDRPPDAHLPRLCAPPVRSAATPRSSSSSASSTTSSWVAGETFGKTCAIMPSGAMTKVARAFPVEVLPPLDFSTQVP